MLRAVVSFVAIWGLAAAATAQEPHSGAPAPPEELHAPELPLPRERLTRPDTTLLDDTRASGLRARSKHEVLAPPLPIGRRCRIRTAQDRQYVGVLLGTGEWLAIQQDDGKVWIAAGQVISVHELTEDGGAPEAVPEHPEKEELRSLRAEMERLLRELGARDEESDPTDRRERKIIERLRRAAEQELERILQSPLERPTEEPIP